MGKMKTKAKGKKSKLNKRCNVKRIFKASDRTLLLALPKLPVKAKYDYEYFKSWDVKFNDGKGSRFEKPSIRDEPFECPPRTANNLWFPRPDRVVKKYRHPRRRVSNVSKAALKAKPSERVVSLSGPMMRRLLVVREDYGTRLSEEKLHNIQGLIDEHPEKVTKVMKEVFQPRKKPKRWTKKDWKKHKPHILKLSTPRRTRKPPDTRIKAYRPLEKLLPRCEVMSQPMHVYEKPPVIRYGYPKPSALTYVITPRMTAIAAASRVKGDETPYVYGYISPAALRYKPSQRIIDMAQAKTTAQAPDADFKENAFQVSPNALKYKPSKRILELSQPRGS